MGLAGICFSRAPTLFWRGTFVNCEIRFVSGKWRVKGLCNIDHSENCGLGLSKDYDAAIA